MDFGQSCNRRSFCQLFTGALPLMLASPFPGMAAEVNRDDPHFFLNVVFSGGMDASYLFDARPLVMTDKGFIQNYLYKNSAIGIPVLKDPGPLLWQGKNGGATLVTPLAGKLERFRERFSIINGVMMLTNGLISHGQNMYFLFNGQSGNGPSFVPLLGQTRNLPLDSVHLGGFDGDGNGAPTNFSRSIVLRDSDGLGLAEDLRKRPGLDLASPTNQFIQSRLAAGGSEGGLISAGRRKLLDGWQRTPALLEVMKSIEDNPELSGLAKSLAVAEQYFKKGVTSCMTLMVNHDPALDTHSFEEARGQLDLYRGIVGQMESIFTWLTQTAFGNSGRSLMDVTTVMITSEFSRTMRQSEVSIDATGTDHNPLTNSVLLAGKGIKPGWIVGGSDLSAVDSGGQLLHVSQAHRRLDPELMKIMGRPINWESLLPQERWPEQFVLEDYLTFPSIVNTFFHLAGVGEASHYRAGPGSQGRAPILKKLLA